MQETVDHTGSILDHPLATRTSAQPGASRWQPPTPKLPRLEWRQALGSVLVALGSLAIVIAWWQISGTPHPGEQMPSLASGGLGGAALIGLGVILFNSFEHTEDRAALAAVLDRLDELERRVETGERQILAELGAVAGAVQGAGRRPLVADDSNQRVYHEDPGEAPPRARTARQSRTSR